MPLKHFIEDYRFRFARRSLTNYELAIKQVLNFCEKPFNLVTKQDIRKWLLSLEAKGYKPGTLNLKIRAIRLFYSYCLEEELITHNPVENIPYAKKEEIPPYYLTEKQLMQLREVCTGELRQRAIIEVLYSTGVRMGELCNMKLEEINWNERMIFISNGKGNKERMVLFTKECEEYLRAYLNNRTDNLPFVFLNSKGTSAIKQGNVNSWFLTFREKLGFYVSPHTLRHTFAAHLAKKGMPLTCIQVLLGHDRPEDTQRYARLFDQAQKEMYDQWM